VISYVSEIGAAAQSGSDWLGHSIEDHDGLTTYREKLTTWNSAFPLSEQTVQGFITTSHPEVVWSLRPEGQRTKRSYVFRRSRLCFFFVDFGGPVIPSEIRLLENLALTPSKQ